MTVEPLIFPGDKFPVGTIIRTYASHSKFISVAGSSFSYLPSQRDLGYDKYEYYSDLAVAGATPVRGLIGVQIQSYRDHYVFGSCPDYITDADIIRAAQDLLPDNELLFFSIFSDSRIPADTLGMAVSSLTQRLISCAKDESDSAVAVSIQQLCTSTKNITKELHVRSVEDARVIQKLTKRLDKISTYANSIRLNQFTKEKSLLQ